MKKFISKSIMATILCMMIVAGVCASNIDGFVKEKNDRSCMLVSINQGNAQASGSEEYCKLCGRSKNHIEAEAVLKYYNVYYINTWQTECDSYAKYLIRHEPYIYSNHKNLETKSQCDGWNGYSSELQYKKHSYYEEYETPVVNMKQKVFYYNAKNIAPEFTVTFSGKTIASNNYSYYITSNRDRTGGVSRDYTYCKNGTKSVNATGHYYMYILFDPSNTAGPNGTTFLGSLEVEFDVLAQDEVFALQDGSKLYILHEKYNYAATYFSLNPEGTSIPNAGNVYHLADGRTLTITDNGLTSGKAAYTISGTSSGNSGNSGNDSGGSGNNSSGGGNGSTGNTTNTTNNGSVKEEGGNSYYYDASGNKLTDVIVKTDQGYYYFGQSGAREYPDNEYIKGIWFSNGVGSLSYCNGSWKSNSTGWWFEDGGYYPANKWLKIDGKWYYFCTDGYMDYSEYRDGYWLNSDGSWNPAYCGGTWKKDSTGWWFEDGGWYPYNEWLWINGTHYYFNGSGYCTNP